MVKMARGNIIFLVILLTIGVIGYAVYRDLHQSKRWSVESQGQAETPAGISLAAHNAHMTLLQEQLDSASRQIALLKSKPPVTIVQTVPYEVEKVVAKESEKRGADFSIITDPKKHNTAAAPVSLNQYNVFAYKKVIRGVNIYPSLKGTAAGISEITYDISRKVTADGKYIGIISGIDFDNKKIKIGLRMTF